MNAKEPMFKFIYRELGDHMHILVKVAKRKGEAFQVCGRLAMDKDQWPTFFCVITGYPEVTLISHDDEEDNELRKKP